MVTTCDYISQISQVGPGRRTQVGIHLNHSQISRDSEFAIRDFERPTLGLPCHPAKSISQMRLGFQQDWNAWQHANLVIYQQEHQRIHRNGEPPKNGLSSVNCSSCCCTSYSRNGKILEKGQSMTIPIPCISLKLGDREQR